MRKALYILSESSYDRIYGEAERKAIGGLVDIYAPMQTAEAVETDPSILSDLEIIMSGWGGPHIDEHFLEAAPHLEMVFYGAGSIRGIVTDAFWERGVRICGAWGAIGIAVAEYTLSQILFCLKHGWRHAMAMKHPGTPRTSLRTRGACGSTVGIISLGMIGRRVAKLLQGFDLNVLAYDPLFSAEDAAELGVEFCSLDEIFERSDIVTLHTPNLPETRGILTGKHFASMKPGATFINSARGAVIREPEMIEVLASRPDDLFAVLDVTDPEPPEPGSPLYTLPNVVLTPHMAGSSDLECNRQGKFMLDELRRYLEGEPLQYEITQDMAAKMA